jgi:putative endonuclease
MFGIIYRAGDRLRARLRPRRCMPTEAVGRLGEDLAHRFLQAHGYQVVGRNWRSQQDSGDEVDLIARDGELFVFVEVKTRTTDTDAAPDRAIDADKLRAWRRVARNYLFRAGRPDAPCRLDLINIVLEPRPRIQHVPDAFSAG